MRVVKYIIEYLLKRRASKWPGSLLLLATSSEAPKFTNPGCVYTILNKVSARHATQPKIFVRAAWYILDMLSKFQLVKQRSA